DETSWADDGADDGHAADLLPVLAVGDGRLVQVVPASAVIAAPPRIDEDGLLWFSSSWVAIPDAQLPLIQLLVHRFGRTVSDDALHAAYGTRSAFVTATNVRAAMRRLTQRVESVGLRVKRVYRRGYI